MREVIAALLLAAQGDAPTVPDPLAAVPGVAIRYYDVAGATPDAIRAAMDRVRPTDPNDKQRVDALSTWRIGWRWPRRADGTCDLPRADVTFTASLILPRLADPDAVPADARALWDRYIVALRAHEARHLADAYGGVAAVRRAFANANCETATAAARRVLAAINARAVAFDTDTRHGRTEGAEFP